MKKTFFAVLVLLLVFSSAVFAATYDDGSYYYYDDSKLEDFLGMSIGSSFVYETYEAASGKTVDKALQFYGGFSEFAFFNDAPLGIYLDAGVLVNVKDEYNPDVVTKSPAYADVMLGLAYRTKMDGRTSFLLAAGPEFTYFTDKYTYINGYDRVYVEKTYMTMGLTLDAELVYKLGGDFYISVGGKGSVMFLKWMTKEETTWYDRTEESYVDDTDGYFGYRIVPKVSVYFKF